MTLLFTSLGPKAVRGEVRGGRITADAGVLLLRERERRFRRFGPFIAARGRGVEPISPPRRG
ncbi:hypothetical protein [Tautonia rosea]|uniref:hypothetical protein n=1 Tax=Tautonia rosea TaxID=2728037 RepID=UPI001473F2D5|nr:hypothetical protein [Tautonia rosea]